MPPPKVITKCILQGEDGHQSVYEVDVAQHFYAEISVLFGL